MKRRGYVKPRGYHLSCYAPCKATSDSFKALNLYRGFTGCLYFLSKQLLRSDLSSAALPVFTCHRLSLNACRKTFLHHRFLIDFGYHIICIYNSQAYILTIKGILHNLQNTCDLHSRNDLYFYQCIFGKARNFHSRSRRIRFRKVCSIHLIHARKIVHVV